MIDISDVGELKSHKLDGSLILGGNMTLNETMKVFQQIAETNSKFKYAAQMYQHMDLVAHMPVRNVRIILVKSRFLF